MTVFRLNIAEKIQKCVEKQDQILNFQVKKLNFYIEKMET